MGVPRDDLTAETWTDCFNLSNRRASLDEEAADAFSASGRASTGTGRGKNPVRVPQRQAPGRFQSAPVPSRRGALMTARPAGPTLIDLFAGCGGLSLGPCGGLQPVREPDRWRLAWSSRRSS